MELPCIVKRVTYRKDNFAILACIVDRKSESFKPEHLEVVKPYVSKEWKTFTVVIDSLEDREDPDGGSYMFIGDFIRNPSRGWQYKAHCYYHEITNTKESMKRFLTRLPNIQESRAKEIVDLYYHENIIKLLDNNPEKLLKIRGISELRLEAIKEEWGKINHKRGLYQWFSSMGISLKLADHAYKIWGNEARKKIASNPYLMTRIYGINFLKADIIAHRIESNINQKFRVASCMKHCLNEDSKNNGNLCMPYQSFKSNVVNTLIECDSKIGKSSSLKYDEVVIDIIRDYMGDFFAVKNQESKMVFIYEKRVWEMELFISQTLSERGQENSEFSCSESEIINAQIDVSDFIGRDILLDEKQKEAIKSVFNNRVTIITGGGGTGKSTICRCIYSIAKSKNLCVRMMSPTGKAAKILSERTGGNATTIHRGLKIAPEDRLPKVEIVEDILMVDEISMSGIDTMYALMFAVQSNPKTNIVFIGDKNQLPSVSPGNFLSDLINSGCSNVVKLNRIHRQSEESFIAIVANKIANGVSPKIPDEAKDITWRNISPENIGEDINLLIDQYTKENNIDDLQIISPMKKGACGVIALNEIIQKKIASINKQEKRFIEKGFSRFHIGDRVMQIKNNYNKYVFNGDMGKVFAFGEKPRNPEKSDKEEKFIGVNFSGEKKYYFSEEIDELILAWAITVHKFQGSQSKDIAIIIASEASVMMNKELVYTGFTRAEKHLYIYGNEKTYRLASTRSSIKKRFTNMENIIKDFSLKEKIIKTI